MIKEISPLKARQKFWISAVYLPSTIFPDTYHAILKSSPAFFMAQTEIPLRSSLTFSNPQTGNDAVESLGDISLRLAEARIPFQLNLYPFSS